MRPLGVMYVLAPPLADDYRKSISASEHAWPIRMIHLMGESFKHLEVLVSLRGMAFAGVLDVSMAPNPIQKVTGVGLPPLPP